MNHKKALIKVGYTCNNNCIFCHSKLLRAHKDLGTNEVIVKIREARRLGMEMVVLSGGEATIRDDFFTLIRAINSLNMDAGLVTNGRVFSYNDFVDRLLKFRIGYVYLSMQGSTAKSHDIHIQSPSFEQILKGLKNIKGRIPEMTVNVVVTKFNIKELKEIIDIVKSFTPIRLKFSLLEPKGAALERFDEITPDPVESARFVKEAMEYGRASYQRKALEIKCDGFTECMINKYNRIKADLFTDNFRIMSEAFENGFYPVDYGARSYISQCYECSLKSVCPGIYTGYVRNMSNLDIRPVEKNISNSFNYYFSSAKIRPFIDKGKCHLTWNEIKRYDPFRNIFLNKGDKTSLLFTDTSDFDETRLMDIKYNLGQIYMDKSDKISDIVFKKDIAKLRLSPVCKECKYLHDCPGLFIPFKGNIFSSLEKKIELLISKMRENVCDVGCGNSLYRDTLADLIQSGLINYTGIDPKADNIRNEDNIFKIIKATAEDYIWHPNSINHFLIIRSYNHFKNLRAVFDKIFTALIKGGEILLVGNCVYGLVREIDRDVIRKFKGGFKHLRNHTSHDALDFLNINKYPFKVLDHHPIEPAGPNQWLLRLKKI